jgi:hypothetical protein
MPNNDSLGTGGAGVPQGGQMQQDLMALSDPAKRAAQVAATRQAAMNANTQQNLQAATSGQGDIKSLHQLVTDHIMSQTTPDPESQPNQYVKYILDRIDSLKKEQDVAKKVKNVQAVQTYQQVMDTLHQRAMDVQNKLAQRMTAAPQAASAPAPASTSPMPMGMP